MFCQFSTYQFFSFWSLFCPRIRWYLSWVNYFQLLKFYLLKNWYSCVPEFGFPVFQALPLICKMLLRFLRHSETLKWFLKALSIYYIAASFSRLDCLIRQLTLQHYLIEHLVLFPVKFVIFRYWAKLFWAKVRWYTVRLVL